MDPVTYWTQELLRLAKVKARAVTRHDRAAITILNARMATITARIEAMA
jgi:hypothetical protein